MQYVIYLKTTNRCNLCCQHCYNDVMKDTCLDMSKSMIADVIKYIHQRSAAIDKNDNIYVIFHGGEPLLTDVSLLNQIVDECGDLTNVQFTITTNLVYELTPAVFSFFQKMKTMNRPAISTSWDYKIRFIDKQEDKWISNINMLQKNGIDVFPIISTSKYLISDISATSVFQFFDYLHITRINFERLTNTGRASYNDVIPCNRDVDKWLFDAYLASKNYHINVGLFQAIEESINNHSLIGCRLRKCQKYVTTINPDGTIAGCPNTADQTFGTIYNEDVSKRQHCISAEENKMTECYLCKYFRYCNGECFQLKSDSSGCPGLKMTIEHILNQHDNNAPLH